MSDNEQNNDEQVPPAEPTEDSTEETVGEAGEPSLADEAAEQNAEELLESMLGEVERNLVEEYRDRAARAEAELANFRTRVERDRAANRDAVIAEVMDAKGFDAVTLMARAQEPAAKDALATNTQAAVARGVFGVPTFFVGDEMFWGKERLAQVEAALA